MIIFSHIAQDGGKEGMGYKRQDPVKAVGEPGHGGNHWWCQVSFVKAGGSESEQISGTPKSNPRRLPCYSDDVCT